MSRGTRLPGAAVMGFACPSRSSPTSTAAPGLAAAPFSGTSSAGPPWSPPPSSCSRRPRTPAASRRCRRFPSSTTSTTCRPTPRCRPQPGDHGHDQRGRHRPLRAAADGGRAGHHHLDRDADRRRARPARSRRCTSPSRTARPGAALQPADRRVQHAPSRRTPRSGSPPRWPATRCSRPRRSCSATSSSRLESKDGVITGARRPLDLVRRAGAARGQPEDRRRCEVELKDPATSPVIGTPRNRVDALAAVTGREEVRDRPRRARARCPRWCAAPPTLNGSPRRVRNRGRGAGDARASPTSSSSTPASPCAPQTFGQCIDAVRALRWTGTDGPGRRASPTRRSCARLAARRPSCRCRPPTAPLGAQTVRGASSTFYFRSNCRARAPTARSPTCAPTGPTIWAGLKVPIVAQQNGSPRRSGLPQKQVHGQRDHRAAGRSGASSSTTRALEAAKISKAMGKPVKLMWHRADDARARAGCTRWPPRGSGRRTLGGQVLGLRAAPHQRRAPTSATASAR